MISVVIPTRNRLGSLTRTVRALGGQTLPPHELIIVDASDEPADAGAIASLPASFSIIWLHTRAGVCHQRNLGIQRAHGSHVLLCDDDIEPPADYLQKLLAFLELNPAAGAVSGLISEPDSSGRFTGVAVRPSVRHLLFAFLFQHSVWADVESASPLAAPLKRWYRRRGNTLSLAGWPLFTQLREPVVRTTTYGLGAALVRLDWLLASPYDERLGEHGIGDNYGVALGFPDDAGVYVITDLQARHHRVQENRIDAAEANLRRVLALDYFIRTNRRFARSTTGWLVWSLVGKIIASILRPQRGMLRSNLRALKVVLTGNNPLLTGEAAPAATPNHES